MSSADDINPISLYSEVIAKCDACYKEIFQTSEIISKNTGANTVLFIRGHMDRWDSLRSELFRLKIKIARSQRAKKDAYDDGVREYMIRGGGGLSRASHFEERKMNAETSNIVSYKELKFLTDSLEELTSTLFFIKDKIFWLKSVREEVIEEARGLYSLKNDDYTSS